MLAVVVILVAYYLLDRRFFGFFPSLIIPMRRLARISSLRRQVAQNPHDAPGRIALARLYLERRRYAAALRLLDEIPKDLRETNAVICDRGFCLLGLGQRAEGEALLLQALTDNPSLRYGEPWLKLAAATGDPQKALQYLQECRLRNSSSCEAHYRSGLLLTRLGDHEGARRARALCLHTYRTLPRFRRRTERRFALLTLMRVR